MGSIDLLIITIIIVVFMVSAFIRVWAVFYIARSVGYADGTAYLWVFSYFVFGVLSLIVLAFVDWPSGATGRPPIKTLDATGIEPAPEPSVDI